MLLLVAWSSAPVSAKSIRINSRSAMLVDLTSGQTLYEQDPDRPIAPASITKVLSLYLVFEAIREGRIHRWDNAKVSSRAAKTGGSRMGLRTGDIVPVGELIKGMAVVSGNDACVAMAEHLSGSVEAFVGEMNRKARELGMNSSSFQTPNGLPAQGQFTTARDIATLSLAYLRRFPESLQIHSMKSYSYRNATHRNANRLLGTCPGVDGLKTGFVFASGYNLAATAIRGDHRLVAVVLGAPSPGVRAKETARLLNEGYAALGAETTLVCSQPSSRPAELSSSKRGSSSQSLRRSTKQRRPSKQIRVAKASSSAKTKGKLTQTAAPKVSNRTIGNDSKKPARSKTQSKVKVASTKPAGATATAAAPPRKKTKGGNDSTSVKIASADSGKARTKAQGQAKGTSTAKTTAAVKPAKTSAKSKAVPAQAATAKQSTTSTKGEKTSSSEQQKSCAPTPATGKTKSHQKSS